MPYRSILELGKIDTVMQVVEIQLPQFIDQCWELLCREYVSGNILDGIAYNVASRWWDKKHILIGESKWTHKSYLSRMRSLSCTPETSPAFICFNISSIIL
ncbi:DUF234 domain-containing protein [Prevotella sp.]|uniref:DUF234 domain-containing protein n=1 Tax=Prevotella sp. TaxID=59823 RepID=UPI002E79971D|nr:DUF234 domain-containing protein [Prevotella sp.]MEE0669455.1 DUF234 domain-containing protein [Prevotella sp.]